MAQETQSETIAEQDAQPETVGRLIDLVAAAFRISPEEVVKEIAQMAAPGVGDSDPARETILGYVKDPVVRKGASQRFNRDTAIHLKFAHLVINYLDGRRADGQRVSVAVQREESLPWRGARSLCKDVLTRERSRRYERLLGSDPGKQGDIRRAVGAYAICREESSDGRWRQELLILTHEGARSASGCYCTLVTSEVVCRGEWMVVGNMIFCSMSGFREDNSHEVCTVFLTHISGDVLPGFLAGGGTDVKVPVTMPVVAVKVDASESVMALGDLGDEAILMNFRAVKADLRDVQDPLRDLLSKEMRPVTIRAMELNKALRGAFEGGAALVVSTFREFCLSTVQ